MRQASNISTTEYDPLSTLEMSLITIEGLITVRSDKNLGRGTQKHLMETEAKLLDKKKFEQYKYLLGDFDVKDVYTQNFMQNNRIGKAHVTQLILENKNQTYAELVAGYASDRGVPFLVAMILLETMKKCEKGIWYYEMRQSYAKICQWTPKKAENMPPVNFYKMYISNHQSVKGLNDGYILKTLQSFCYNRNAAAAVLKMSRPTLTARLQSIGYLLEDGSVRPDFEEWYLRQAKLEAYCESNRENESVVKRIQPPVVKQGWQTNVTYSDLQIKAAYRENGYDVKKTAVALGLTATAVKQRLGNFDPTIVSSPLEDFADKGQVQEEPKEEKPAAEQDAENEEDEYDDDEDIDFSSLRTGPGMASFFDQDDFDNE